MDDTSIVKIMQSLDLDYSKAILSTKHFEQSLLALNQQLSNIKAISSQVAKDINASFSQQFGSAISSKTIVDQYGKPLVTVQTEAKKAASSLSQMASSAQSSANKAAASMNAATGAATNHGQAVKDVAQQYNVFGSEMQRRAGWFLSGSIWYGGIKAAKETVQTLSEVEMGMTEIARVMEDSTFIFKDYRDELLQLGVDYGFTFETVQDIALRWAQAGYNVADSLRLTRTSLLALNTAELDAANATESMVGIMAQWGLQAEDLMFVIDKINKTADDYTVTSQDLVDGLLRSSSAARIMNLSLDETISLLTVMREASGRTGREVGNALNSILSYIQRPGSISVLESMGIQVFADEAKTEFRNVMGIFEDVAAKWNTTSDAIKDGFVAAADDAGLFNEELATALGMQEQWNDLQQRDIAQASAGVYRRNYYIGMIERLATAQEVLNNMTDAAGYSQSENARTVDTLEKKYESLKAAAQQLMVALGDAGLLDILKSLTTGATNLASSLSKINPEMKALVTTALELLAVTQGIKAVGNLFGVDATFGGVMAVLPGWTKLVPIIIAAAGAIALYAHNYDSLVKQEMKESVTRLRTQREEINTIEDLLEEYESLQVSVADTEEEKRRLHEIEVKLAEIFPQTKTAIDDQNQAYTTQIDLIKQLSEEKKKAYQDDLERTVAEGAMRAQALQSEIADLEQEKSNLLSDSTGRGDFVQKYSDLYAKIKEELKKGMLSGESIKSLLEIPELSYAVGTDEKALLFVDYMEAYLEAWKENSKRIADITQKIDENKELIKEYEAAKVELEKLIRPENDVPEWVKQYENFYKGLGTQKQSQNQKPSSGSGNDEPYLGNLDKYVLNLDRYMALNAALDGINIALEKNNALESAAEGSGKISYIKQENELLQQKQDALHAINEERRKELAEIKAYLSGQGVQIDDSNNLLNADDILRAKTAKYNTMPGGTNAEKDARKEVKDNLDILQDKLKRFVDLVHREIPSASAEWFDLSTSIAKNNKEIKDLIETEQDNIAKLQKDLAEEWNKYYKEQFKEQQKSIKNAYDERIKKIKETAEAEKKAHQDRIEQIDDELKALDRGEEERDYSNRMKELQDELAYWSVRTGREAREKMADLQKQIAEEEHDREIELTKQTLEDEKETLKDKIDAIDDATQKEVEKWEATYVEIEEAFDDHALNIIASAGTMAEGAYEQWVEKYFNPLMESLSSGSAAATTVRAMLGQKSIMDEAAYQLASSIVDYKRQYEQEGNTFAHEQAKIYYQQLADIAPSIAAELHKMNYEQANQYLGSLSGLSTNLTVTPLKLSGKVDLSKQQSSAVTTGSKTVIIQGNLLNIEENHMEDDVDGEIVARQIKRNLENIK